MYLTKHMLCSWLSPSSISHSNFLRGGIGVRVRVRVKVRIRVTSYLYFADLFIAASI